MFARSLVTTLVTVTQLLRGILYGDAYSEDLEEKFGV